MKDTAAVTQNQKSRFGSLSSITMRILITAGPTREPLDTVRFLSNHSSGSMGIALAEAAATAGHATTLLLGPVCAPPPPGVRAVRFSSCADLQAALQSEFPACDLLIMTAAVADYRLAAPLAGKVERGADLALTLTPTPDLVAGCAKSKRPDQTVVAFALEESTRLCERAQEKMRRKGVDAIVANPLETMNAPTIRGTLMRADGRSETPGTLPKAEFARWLVAQLAG